MNAITTKKFNYNAIEDKALATFMKGEETAIRASARRAQGELIEIGQRLEAVKERAGHGLFMDWTSGALGYTHRHAMGFMHVAQTFGKMEFNSNLPLSQTAIFALASPSVSDETRMDAIEAAEAGEIKTVADVKAFAAAQNHAADNAHNDEINESFPDPFDDTTPEPDDIEREFEPSSTLQSRAAAAAVVRDTMPPPDPKTNEPAENELTDDEWLITLPLFEYLIASGDKALLLRTDALAWRTMHQSGALGSFKHAATRALDFKSAETPLGRVVSRACFIKHPKEWGACVKCRAKGCPECGYAGYQLEAGLDIEQLGAR